jgi:hypothetical protein
MITLLLIGIILALLSFAAAMVCFAALAIANLKFPISSEPDGQPRGQQPCLRGIGRFRSTVFPRATIRRMQTPSNLPVLR